VEKGNKDGESNLEPDHVALDYGKHGYRLLEGYSLAGREWIASMSRVGKAMDRERRQSAEARQSSTGAARPGVSQAAGTAAAAARRRASSSSAIVSVDFLSSL
jgi:hypothetical protein